METDCRHMCEVLVGLGEVDLLEVEELGVWSAEVDDPVPWIPAGARRVGWEGVVQRRIGWFRWSICPGSVVRWGCDGGNAAGCALNRSEFPGDGPPVLWSQFTWISGVTVQLLWVFRIRLG